MARKKMRPDRFALTPKEQAEAEAAFTREFVHARLAEATKGDPSIEVHPVDSPEVGVLMQVLAFCREMVARQRQSWAPSGRNFERFAALVREIAVVVPLLKVEVEDALRRTEHDLPDVTSTPPMLREVLISDWLRGLQVRPAFAEAVALLDLLGRIGEAASNHPVLSPPPPPADNWRNYVDGIRDWFNQAVIRNGARSADPIGNPFYTFMVLITPAVTGEHVAFGQVRDHCERQRPSDTRQHRGWYR